MDPRLVGPQQRAANLSRLMLCIGKASKGERVNFCPFGCRDADLDDVGHCKHLVGFTTDGKTMEPYTPPDEKGRRHVLGATPVPVLSTDVLERITVSHRVYRDDKPVVTDAKKKAS